MHHEEGDQFNVCLIKTLPGNKTQWDKITLDEGQKSTQWSRVCFRILPLILTPPENYTLGKTTTLIMFLE